MTKEKIKEAYWTEEKEVLVSNRPLKLVLFFLKHIPLGFTYWVAYPVSFFYFIFSKWGRLTTKIYQKHLKSYTNGESPKKISSYKQILSFSVSLVEKMAGWLGKLDENNIDIKPGDYEYFIDQLKQKKGAVFLSSHLGNMELLRSLTSFNQTGMTEEVPVTILMETSTSDKFNQMIKSINSKSNANVITTDNIGPETIVQMQEAVDKGGILVIAGDRTSKNARQRNIKKPFLGEPANFPYGVFLICALLKAPVYYVFGLRQKIAGLHPINDVYVEKSKVDLDVPRTQREQKISELCDEYIGQLEKYCKMYPYHWYNFFNFWLSEDENK